MSNADKTHCPQGHPYDSANTYTWRGRRYCKRCRHVHIYRLMKRERAGWRHDPKLVQIAAALRRAGHLIWRVA